MNGLIDLREIEIYADENGKEPFINWLVSLDKSVRNRVIERLNRVEVGNFGDHRRIDKHIRELRLHFGSGYRIYYVELDRKIILLLAGGDKSSQSKDIEKAKDYFKEYKENINEKVAKV